MTTKPTIIISHTAVAAPARRRSSTRLASSTRSEVPQAPTPPPTIMKARTASTIPAVRSVNISTVARAASTPPAARTAMPPMIQGVRRPPRSDP